MKTLEQIKRITEQSIQKKKDAAVKAKKTSALKAKKDQQEERKEALNMVQKWYVGWIEEAAKKGKHTFEIDMGIYEGGKLSNRELLEMKYAKKYLKDFHPTFTDERREAGVYNYDGECIDTHRYTACCIHFNW